MESVNKYIQMKQNMQTQLTFLLEVFPVNHIAVPEIEKATKTHAISGLKCLEQFGKFNRPGLWAKTFAGLLIGMEGWYSTRCRLTWKLKATKCYRFYFQLQASTRHTKDTEFGLLLTPSVTMISERSKEAMERIDGQEDGTAREPSGTDIGNDKRNAEKQYDITNNDNKGIQGREASGYIKIGGQKPEQFFGRYDKFNDWNKFPTQSPICGGNDGVSNRVDRLKQLGNAVVPQVVYQIFKTVEQYETLIK